MHRIGVVRSNSKPVLFDLQSAILHLIYFHYLFNFLCKAMFFSDNFFFNWTFMSLILLVWGQILRVSSLICFAPDWSPHLKLTSRISGAAECRKTCQADPSPLQCFTNVLYLSMREVFNNMIVAFLFQNNKSVVHFPMLPFRMILPQLQLWLHVWRIDWWPLDLQVIWLWLILSIAGALVVVTVLGVWPIPSIPPRPELQHKAPKAYYVLYI